jgi:hypothetical protein
MDALDSLLEQIKPVASEHGMDAYIVGSVRWVPPTDHHDGYVDDGRLLKLAPIGVPSRPLLEIEQNNGLRLYKHRDAAATRQYKGRPISAKWVFGFISANSELARQLSNAQPPPKPSEPPPPPMPYSQQELDALHRERHEQSCSCRGMSENCPRCYGSGKYVVDGLGNRV